MSWNWVWGDKTPEKKKVKVENKSIPLERKNTKLSVSFEVEVDHPITMTGFGAINEAYITFHLPEGAEVKEAAMTQVDVLS